MIDGLGNRLFRTADVVRLLGVKRLRLHQWIERGFITPAVRGFGSGYPNQYSPRDLYRIAVFAALVDYGIARKAAARLVKKIDFQSFDGLLTIKFNFETVFKELDRKHDEIKKSRSPD